MYTKFLFPVVLKKNFLINPVRLLLIMNTFYFIFPSYFIAFNLEI